MPTRSSEAHRALEQLEAFHAALTRPSDTELRGAIERVIGLFKTNLFQALLDIQDFYDNTLLNERVPLDLKTLETKKLAERWETNPPFGGVRAPRSPPRHGSSLFTSEQQQQRRFQPSAASFPASYAATTENGGAGNVGAAYTNGFDKSTAPEEAGKSTTSQQHSYSYHEQSRHLTKDGWQTSEYKTQTVDGPGGFQTESFSNTGLVDEQGHEWEVEDVVLEKNQFGLGFSISGGRDHSTGPCIRVTDIGSSGAVARDGRIRIGDIILKVNTVETVDVPHQVAVDALKNSGSVVRLLVKRLKPPLATSETYRSSPVEQQQQQPLSRVSPIICGGGASSSSPPPVFPHQTTGGVVPDATIHELERKPGIHRMELIKMMSASDGRRLGFSIAGGVGNQHFAGDNGIFVTRIILDSPAYFDGRLQRGDQIIAVDNVLFTNVTHQFAVQTLKNTGERVSLLYVKCPHPELLLQERQLEESDRSRSLQAFDTTSQVVPAAPAIDSHSVGGSQSQLAYFQQQQQQQFLDSEPRLVRLRKGDTGLGFNIVGGEDGEPVYVSHILPGGAASLSGNVRKGDILLRVNDVDLTRASHAQAAQTLKAIPLYSEVQLLLKYRPLDFQSFEQKLERLKAEMLLMEQQQQQQQQQFQAVQQQQQLEPHQIPQRMDFFVRALFDNEPSRDTGPPRRSLSFRYGDILHVLNSADDDWWTARKVESTGDESPEGIIPSRKRVEKRERQRRKQVNFNAGSQSLGRNTSAAAGAFSSGGGMEGRRGSRSQLSFSRRFPFVKSTEKLNEYGADGAENAAIEEPIHSYKIVTLLQIGYVRPVIILGALKDRINDELVTQYPERFSSCVPHTSRPPRENEVHGRDYYFVTKAEMERDIKSNLFIEAGQFQNNLYGTSIAAVREVADSGRHCILDVSGNAIRRLQDTARIFPVSLFVKPFGYHQLREWTAGQQLSDEEAVRQFERCQRQEQSFGDLFTAVVTGQTPEEIYAKVLHTINEQSQRDIWVPTHEQLP